ncbi:hypothetical protein PR002_g14100 [Phytophthora rubi]|uniref:Uncharacterized protein n=1 Tax=Phytophthora rubi TaxID=129364 RepID=A0A6A3L7D1_9STRA|nr:hypothetical protein PR002_g14100 [Phytophthora rubi]
MPSEPLYAMGPTDEVAWPTVAEPFLETASFKFGKNARVMRKGPPREP